jgi:hypothetical protein
VIGTGQIIVAETADVNTDERWFDRIDITDDPWRDWFGMLAFPRRHDPLDAWIERRVEDLCRAADVRRLAVEPATMRFAQIWATFRRHHEALEERGKHRTRRWLVWRASALRVVFERAGFQDEIDADQARAKLVETLREFWPGIRPDGSCDGHGCNFWRAEIVTVAPSDEFAEHGIAFKTRTDPLAEYAAMVLTVIKTAAGDRP